MFALQADTHHFRWTHLRLVRSGLFKSCLPGNPSINSENNTLLPETPIIDEGTASQVIFSYNGTLAGSTFAIFPLPETRIGVFVLAKTKATYDSADLIDKAVLQVTLNSPIDIDFVQLAKTATRLRDPSC